VTWYEAVKFCNWLSRLEGLAPAYELTGEIEEINVVSTRRNKFRNPAWRLNPDSDGYRLPTEAQWELACRTGSTTNNAIGDADSLTDSMIRSYAACGLSRNEPCRSKMPFGLGLFDMYGNVAECCDDWFAEFDDRTEVEDPTGPKQEQSNDNRVVRGGFYVHPPIWFESGRKEYSDWVPHIRLPSVGFRVARPLSK
jgi:formylglycine-generating enzyme required for sulfatase activity